MSGWLQCSFLSSGLREKSLKVGAYTYRVLAFRVYREGTLRIVLGFRVAGLGFRVWRRQPVKTEAKLRRNMTT